LIDHVGCLCTQRRLSRCWKDSLFWVQCIRGTSLWCICPHFIRKSRRLCHSVSLHALCRH